MLADRFPKPVCWSVRQEEQTNPIVQATHCVLLAFDSTNVQPERLELVCTERLRVSSCGLVDEIPSKLVAGSPSERNARAYVNVFQIGEIGSTWLND